VSNPLAIALSSRGFLDLGELGGRQLGVGTGGTAAAQGIHPALEVAAVPAVGALAGHAELVGDLGLGAALGERRNPNSSAGRDLPMT
jgi:hypothetical protein